MGIMGYKPPMMKAPPNPYASSGPVNPFGAEAASIAPMPNQPVGNYDKEHLVFNPDIGGSLLKVPTIKPHFFEKGGLGSKMLDILAETTLSYNASQGDPTSLSILRQRETAANRTAEDTQWQSRWKMQRDAELADKEAARNAPQFFSGNEDRVRFDPRTNTASTVYDAPTDAENYAKAQGFQPGTPEYGTALQDFTLRGNGPSAYDFRADLEGVRADNKSMLQDRRYGHQASLRGMPTYRQTHPLARGQGGHKALPLPKATETQTATGPGGHKIVLRGGRWLDAQTGRPVG